MAKWGKCFIIGPIYLHAPWRYFTANRYDAAGEVRKARQCRRLRIAGAITFFAVVALCGWIAAIFHR